MGPSSGSGCGSELAVGPSCGSGCGSELAVGPSCGSEQTEEDSKLKRMNMTRSKAGKKQYLRSFELSTQLGHTARHHSLAPKLGPTATTHISAAQLGHTDRTHSSDPPIRTHSSDAHTTRTHSSDPQLGFTGRTHYHTQLFHLNYIS